MRHGAKVTFVLAFAFLAACGGTAGTTIHDGSLPDAHIVHDGWTDALTPQARALLEVYVLDIWAQPLPETQANLVITIDGEPLSHLGHPVATASLEHGGSLSITLSAPDHESLIVDATYDGSDTLGGLAFLTSSNTDGHGISVTHEMRTVNGRAVPVHTVYLGLRHRWFSASGRPARRGNHVDLLVDGEEAWAATRADLNAAADSVLISTWYWESDFELVRDWTTHPYLTAQERWDNTILGTLELSPAFRRVIVGQFWGQDSILSWITTDAQLRAHAETPDDDFEFMGQGNGTEGVFWFEVEPFRYQDRVRGAFPESTSRLFEPEPPITSTVPPRWVDLTLWPVSLEIQHASFHQKFLVMDGAVAYLGGMNFRRTDWDSSQHLVFDHRRMLYEATVSEREDVMNKDALPDVDPRKDYVVRIEGPAVQDVADVFQLRWRDLIASGVEYAALSSDFTIERNLAPLANGLQVQVTTTLPEPFWEHSIAETWFNAVRNAEQFILVEDQYFRAPMLNDAIVERLQQVPALKLVVITTPISEWGDPGCVWTHLSHERFRASFPNRYRVYQVRSFDTMVTFGFDETESRFVDMNMHSKMLIVDDKFMSVGSCNKNNRGMVYEGEMNLAVLDSVWVRAARQRILTNMLPPGTPETNDVDTWWTQLEDAAAWNDYVYANWEAEGWDISLDGAPLPVEYTPSGFLYGLDFGTPSDCLFEDVGPDMV